MNKIVRALTHPRLVLGVLLERTSYLWSDRTYLKWRFRLSMGRKLNLDNPVTFNEKLQWLKLYNRRPEYTIMVDKVRVKEYVAGILGEEYIIPTLGVWDNPDDIDFNALPNQFVLKCNHNSGLGMCICKDKSKLDMPKVRKELRKGLEQNYFLHGREWPYKNVPRRILAEKFMVDESGTELKDYKYYCFGGEAKFMFIASGRLLDSKTFSYYNMNFEKLPFEWGAPASNEVVKRPETFYKMKMLAEILAKDLPEVRIDFYDVNGNIYFGEITFFDGSGMESFNPKEWDEHLGKLIKLPPPFVMNI